VGTASGLDQHEVYAMLDAALANGDDKALFTGNPHAIIPGLSVIVYALYIRSIVG
jgi:hypothetical protein